MADAPTPPALDALQAILHDAERVIGHQVQAIEELDDKSEHMIGLGVALLAGGLSLATVVVTTEASIDPSPRFFWLLLAGAAINVVAIVAFLESYIGFRRGVEVRVGPSIDWLKAKANDGTWSLASHHLSLLSDDGYPAYYRFNLQKMLHSAGARRFGLFTLSVAVLVYTVALVYLLATAM